VFLLSLFILALSRYLYYHRFKRYPEYLPEYRHQRTTPTGPAADRYSTVVKEQKNYLKLEDRVRGQLVSPVIKGIDRKVYNIICRHLILDTKYRLDNSWLA
jgi:hypothetical protein